MALTVSCAALTWKKTSRSDSCDTVVQSMLTTAVGGMQQMLKPAPAPPIRTTVQYGPLKEDDTVLFVVLPGAVTEYWPSTFVVAVFVMPPLVAFTHSLRNGMFESPA